MKFKKFLKLLMLFLIILVLTGGIASAGFFLGVKFNSKSNSESSVVFDGIKKAMGINEEKTNMLVFGSADNGGPPDTIFFVSYNPSAKKVNLISIPRDTWVPDSVDHKINSAIKGKGKEKATEKDVENILGVPINYYVLVHLKAFKTVVDEIGGIPMDVPIDMHYHDPYQKLYIDLNKGYQVLNGTQAVGFVRFRHGYADQDLGRIKAQQAFISAFKDQLLKPQNITKVPSIINTAMSNVETDMPLNRILGYASGAANINSSNITMVTLPGAPQYINGLSYYVHDKAKTQQLVEQLFNTSNNQTAQNENISTKDNKDIKVEVYNGTGIPGLATEAANQLKAKGFKIVKTGNYGSSNLQTTEIVQKDNNSGGNAVRDALRAGNIKVKKNNSSADITVILGRDSNI